MKKVESKLKKMRLRKSGADLDRRIASIRPDNAPKPVFVFQRVPLWATLSIAIIMGAAGFFAGTFTKTTEQEAPKNVPSPPPVKFSVACYSQSGRNFFDYTRPSKGFLSQGVKITTSTQEPKDLNK